MNHLDSQYDPVRDYVDSALTAENRGGVQVSRTIDEKLKNKALQFSNYPKNSFPSALDFGGRTLFCFCMAWTASCSVELAIILIFSPLVNPFSISHYDLQL